MKIPSKKILIIGSTGFLGSALSQLLNSDELSIHTTDKSLLDLSKPISPLFEDYLKNHSFEYVIICAAISDVEMCYQNQILSNQVNVEGMKKVLLLLKKYSAIPIFFSSDYVFSNKLTPYKESDLTNPTTIYGFQKLTIELFIQKHFGRFLIFRTSKLMSKTIHKKNILLPILKNLNEGLVSNCFKDQFLNPVFVEDIANVLTKAIRAELVGLFHLGTKKLLTRYELGILLANLFNYDEKLIKSTSMSDMTFSEPRPTNNMLNCEKIEKVLEFKFCEIQEAYLELKKLI